MDKIYYIDSENVGETWIDSLDQINSRFIIFYTKNSPKIPYSQVVQLMNAKNRPDFVECYEGNNGLDFQLVSYLGYELCADNTKEMVIVSNDTGFDTVVHFWIDRGMNVKRISRSELIQSNYNQPDTPVSDEEFIAESSSDEEDVTQEDCQELYTIINCIGADNLSQVYTALTRFYGEIEGRIIYKNLKKNKFPVPIHKWDKNTRIKKIIELIIHYANINIPNPTSVTSFLMKNVTTNNQAMVKKFNNEFGSFGMELHRVFKNFYSILTFIKK